MWLQGRMPELWLCHTCRRWGNLQFYCYDIWLPKTRKEGYRHNIPHLWNKVFSKPNVLSHCMGQAGGDEVNISLDLMHHGIRVGHPASVLHADTSVFANHVINFFPHFSWQGRSQNLWEVKKLEVPFVGSLHHCPIVVGDGTMMENYVSLPP